MYKIMLYTNNYGQGVSSPYEVDSWDGDSADAVILARLHAEEHYRRTMNDTRTYRETALGASFTTNNGSDVIYKVSKG